MQITITFKKIEAVKNVPRASIVIMALTDPLGNPSGNGFFSLGKYRFLACNSLDSAFNCFNIFVLAFRTYHVFFTPLIVDHDTF